jgi:phosphoribosylformimino-5-aminoimidazole carboxamide ribotide isomerase
MNIYPATDIKGGRCVRLRQGVAADATTYYADPADPARAFLADGARWLHVVDLDGAFDGAPRNLDALRRIADAAGSVNVAGSTAKVQFGGGLRDEHAVAAALAAGADRVILGTKAAADAGFVAAMVAQHGAKIAVGIDAKDGRVAVKGWVEVTEHRAVEFAARMHALGVITIIYTDIATDGMLTGPNFSALETMLRGTGAGVIASGGVSRREDIIRLRELADSYSNLDGAIVGKALYEHRVSLPDLLAISN